MTQDEALKILWSAKSMYQVEADGKPKLDDKKRPIVNPKGCDAFVYATLLKDVTMHVSTTEETHRNIDKTRIAKADTRVLVTMVSRLGHVGVRDDHLVPASNGYYAGVMPEDLKDWGEKP